MSKMLFLLDRGQNLEDEGKYVSLGPVISSHEKYQRQ